MSSESITPQGMQELKAELADLEGRARRELAEKIKRAREHGDLSENAEYHAAKEEQAHLETRIARLAERLRNAQVVEAPADASVVSFGAPVTVTDEAGKEHTWTLVGPTEANLREGKLSAESPVAVALLGKAPGEEVAVQTPGGTKRFTVVRLG